MHGPGFESLHWEEGKGKRRNGKESGGEGRGGQRTGGQKRGRESQRAEAGLMMCACHLRTQEMET